MRTVYEISHQKNRQNVREFCLFFVMGPGRGGQHKEGHQTKVIKPKK